MAYTPDRTTGIGTVDLNGKNVSIGAVILAVLGSGGYFATADNPVYTVLDQRYWTIAQENLEAEFDIEDELAEIQRRVDKGKDTADDHIRRAVLEERLKRLRIK